MGLYKNGRAETVKTAESKGYSWNSTKTAMTNGSKSLTFSPTGQSANLNGGSYNTSADIKKSTKW